MTRKYLKDRPFITKGRLEEIFLAARQVLAWVVKLS